jgi:hypothetical protein
MLLYMDRWAVKSLLLLKLWSGGIGEQLQSNARLIGCPCLLLLQACFGCYDCALVAMVVLSCVAQFGRPSPDRSVFDGGVFGGFH